MIKYFVFFIILGTLDDRYKTLIIDNSHNNSELGTNIIGYFIEVVFAVIMFSFLLFIMVALLFNIRNTKWIFPAFLPVVVVEYFLYESMASYVHFDKAGLINGIISIVLFFAFFRKIITSSSS